MQLVINACYGGFSLSQEACDELHCSDDRNKYDAAERRSDPDLVACVKRLGPRAYGRFAALRIVTVPNDLKYTIEDYDGIESVHEKHRVWRC